MANFSKPPTLNDDQRAVDIYRAAAEIIREKGFDATSMGDIAEAVDLTKGGLYYYIKGKEALLFAIMSFAMGRLEEKVLKPASEIADAELRLATLISRHLRLMLDEPAAMVVLADEEERLNAQHRPRIAERKACYVNTARAWLEDILGSGEEVGLDPEVAAASLLAMVEGVVHWYAPGAGMTREGVVDQVTRMALRSLEPTAAERREQAVA